MKTFVSPCSAESPQSCSTEYDYIDETHVSPTTSLLPSKAGLENATEKVVVNKNLNQPNLSSLDGDYEAPIEIENSVETTITFKIHKTIEATKMVEDITIIATITAKILADKDFRIQSENIQMLNKRLGTGNSAYVDLAEYTNNSVSIKVAVKTLKLNCLTSDTLKEIKLLSSCKHENIVSFIGWMETPDEQMCIITEYMGGGNLHTYLTTPDKLLLVSTVFTYIFQVLDAMIYLSHKHILHRDLAARNCL
uniref:Protein kinase domain-containing protein n=1 Tax=Panagrolaimus davidi TaxID=227884 RepID=A0A914P9D7_9BILA